MKPWNKEPTPLTDKEEWETQELAGGKVVLSEIARDLERQVRRRDEALKRLADEHHVSVNTLLVRCADMELKDLYP